MFKKYRFIFGLLLISSLLLAACTPTTNSNGDGNGDGNGGAVNEPNEPNEPAADEPDEPAADEPDEVVVERTTRVGGWLDQIVMSVVDSSSAVTQLTAGAIDVYAGNLGSPEDLQAVADAGLERAYVFGLYYELTFNVVQDFPDGRLNPFGIAKVREAMNWLVDRQFLVDEVYGGNGVPKWFPLTAGFPDYARYVEIARPLEAKYGYNFDLAEATITAEMEAAGAEMVDGTWHFNGEEIVLVFLIRNDSDGTRIPIGDYVSNQLEAIGFAVDRQYKTSSEASAFWIGGNPEDGTWNIYTGAWSSSSVSRNSGPGYEQMYSPDGLGGGVPLWEAYRDRISDEFYNTLEDLLNSNYTNAEERRALFATAMELQFEHSFRVFLVDGQGGTPWIPNVSVAYNLASGVDSNFLTPFTIRFDDQEGGDLNWGNADLFVDPPNPIAGSNWTFDAQWQNATHDYGTIANPYTGLILPQRVESMDLVVETGIPIVKTLDWVELSFEDVITVPADTWVDWDADSETFITAGEKFPDGLTTLTKATVTYPSELWTTAWHDGSPLSMGDFVMNMIMTFTPGTPGTNVFDESSEGALTSLLTSFKGVRIISEDPLVIETYTDAWQPDAENNVTSWYPVYGFGIAGWHAIAMGNETDANLDAAYSSDKADANEIEWQSWIGGPSLELLSANLAALAADGTIPYAATLGEYVSADEAASRYANLAAFFDEHGHYWVGTGPYILDEVFLVEKQAVLIQNPDFVDLSDRWGGFAAPKFATTEIDGSARVSIGSEATFDVFVTFEGEPYPSADISEVKYMLFNAEGDLVEVGSAELVSEGLYSVTLSADTTAGLAAGANKIEVAVLPIPVSIPSFSTFEFVTE